MLLLMLSYSLDDEGIEKVAWNLKKKQNKKKLHSYHVTNGAFIYYSMHEKTHLVSVTILFPVLPAYPDTGCPYRRIHTEGMPVSVKQSH